jgi:hypothetical protein
MNYDDLLLHVARRLVSTYGDDASFLAGMCVHIVARMRPRAKIKLYFDLIRAIEAVNDAQSRDLH